MAIVLRDELMFIWEGPLSPKLDRFSTLSSRDISYKTDGTISKTEIQIKKTDILSFHQFLSTSDHYTSSSNKDIYLCTVHLKKYFYFNNALKIICIPFLIKFNFQTRCISIY